MIYSFYVSLRPELMARSSLAKAARLVRALRVAPARGSIIAPAPPRPESARRTRRFGAPGAPRPLSRARAKLSAPEPRARRGSSPRPAGGRRCRLGASASVSIRSDMSSEPLGATAALRLAQRVPLGAIHRETWPALQPP